MSEDIPGSDEGGEEEFKPDLVREKIMLADAQSVLEDLINAGGSAEQIEEALEVYKDAAQDYIKTIREFFKFQ